MCPADRGRLVGRVSATVKISLFAGRRQVVGHLLHEVHTYQL